jgi:hypothetical protein
MSPIFAWSEGRYEQIGVFPLHIHSLGLNLQCHAEMIGASNEQSAVSVPADPMKQQGGKQTSPC